MKNYSIEDIVSIFEQSGIIMFEATLAGDYKLNNKEGMKIPVGIAPPFQQTGTAIPE